MYSMSALEAACCVISQIGCFADPNLVDDDFDHQDHEGRVSAATDVLIDFVTEWFADDTGKLPFHRSMVRAIAGLLARAMVAQHDYTKNDNAETDSAMTAEVVDELRAAERALATVKQLLGGA
jgi:hypothetical protein